MLKKLYYKLLNIIAQPLTDILPGEKTMLFGWIASIIGAWNWLLSTNFFNEFCCTNLHLLCNFEGSAFYGKLILVIGVLTKILRFATVTGVKNL